MGDDTGTYHFMSLKTLQVLTKGPGSWMEVPITDIAIARVEALAKREGQPMVQDSNLLVEWRPNQPLDEDDKYDDDYEPSVTDGEDDIELEIDDVSENTDGGGSVTHNLSQMDLPAIRPVPKQITHPQVEDVGTDTLVKDGAIVEEDSNTCIAEEEGVVQLEEEGATHVEEEGVSTNMDGESDDTENNVGVAQGGYNLRPNRSREYSHWFDPQVYSVTNTHASHTSEATTTVVQRMFSFVFTQMSAWAGIKKHGQSARDALTAEFAQLDYKGAYEPIHAADLTEAQQTSALRIINLIKEKRNGRLKGRSVAHGRPQRELYTKDETSSPTTPESVLLTPMIDAVEDRHIAVVDVTGAYLNVDMDDFVLIRLLGDDVDMMCNANPTYEQFVTNENGRKTLFLQLKKALYGCVKSALLWYRLFCDMLQDLCFVLNRYDPCVANAQNQGITMHYCLVCR